MGNAAYKQAAAKAGVPIDVYAGQRFNQLLGDADNDMVGALSVIYDANIIH